MIGDDGDRDIAGSRLVSTTATASAAVDTSTPSVARIYDYALGGKDNYQVDRQATHEMVRGVPDLVATARENRAWLGRGVRYLARQGIHQFLDNGSGLPTQMNVHQVAQQECPGARVVYVDNDPVVLAHGRALLGDQHTTVVAADMTRPQEILADPSVQALIDFTQPVAALYASVMHCLPDTARPREAVASMLDALPSGSYLLLSHLVSSDEDAVDFLTQFMTARTQWGRVRTKEEVASYFDGLDLIEPGLTDITRWRPDPHGPPMHSDTPFEVPSGNPEFTNKIWEFGGIAKKP